MKEYLKMADAFPHAKVGKSPVKPWVSGEYFVFYENQAEYAANAINSHDELVEEVERLTASLNHANSNHELFERQYYLEKDKCEDLQAEAKLLRGALQQCVDALYIAHKFCGNHTADECGDEIAIPISDALVVESKLVAP